MKRMAIIFTLLIVGVVGLGFTILSHAINPYSGILLNLFLYAPLFIIGILFLIIEIIKEYNLIKEKV